MRALQFKIEVEALNLKDYHDIHREDLDFITKQAQKNNLNWYPASDKGRWSVLVFTGKHEDLFTFLYDVAYRYDIEIM